MTQLRGDVPKRDVDLQELVLFLADRLGDDDLDVWLFGSRKDETGSTRSDIDILVSVDKPIDQEAMQAIWDKEPYLDVFWVMNGVAKSIVNESAIRAANDAALIAQLGAVQLLNKGSWRRQSDKFRWQQVLAERNPAATLVPLYDLDDAVPAERADILVVTALSFEHRAVVKVLAPNTDPDSSRVLIHLKDSRGSPWRIRVVLVNKMGSVPMALATADAIRRTKAAHVVLVGITAGIPKDGLCVGDVVIPSEIFYYESGKVTQEGFVSNYESVPCDSGIQREAQVILGDDTPFAFKIHATKCVMACGEKVIANTEERQRLIRTLSRQLLAVEMESYGLARAATNYHRRPTVIKGVSDTGDEDKKDDDQRTSALNAAEVLREMVVRGVFAASK